MLHRLNGLLLGGLLTVLIIAVPQASAAGPADVTLRAEGKDRTLIARTALRTDLRTVNKSGNAGEDCTGTSAAGALEIASAGDWGGSYFDGLGYSVERLAGETHAFPDPEFFSFWLNNRESQVGVCQAELQEGDEVLFFVARCDFNQATFECDNPPVLPLGLTVPRTAAPGAPFDVRVVEYARDGTATGVAGATVEGATASATTDANGNAALTLTDRGTVAVRARKENRARTAENVCVTDGADGFCGTTKPNGSSPPQGGSAEPGAGGPGTATCTTSGDDGRCGTVDRRAPSGRIASVLEGQRFARGRGPRELLGAVGADGSGIAKVELRLTRNDRGRCWAYDAVTERQRRLRRCGASRGTYFFVTDRAQWSYLLPGVLPRGRYVLDLRVTDRAGNVDRTLQRGRNRIVFRVG